MQTIHAASRADEARPFSPTVTISNRMVRLLADYVGRGPTKARTTLTGNLVVVTFGETMTRAEQNLVAAGESGTVLEVRRIFHSRMREEAVAAVEDVVGRQVVSYMADLDPHANMALMAFVLDTPAEEGATLLATAHHPGTNGSAPGT